MKDLGLYLFILFCLISGLRACNFGPIRIIEIQDSQPYFVCDEKYRTLVEDEDGARSILCGKFGEVGETIKTAHK